MSYVIGDAFTTGRSHAFSVVSDSPASISVCGMVHDAADPGQRLLNPTQAMHSVTCRACKRVLAAEIDRLRRQRGSQ